MGLETSGDRFAGLEAEYAHLFTKFDAEQLADRGYEHALKVLEAEDATTAEISDVLETLFPGCLADQIKPLVGKEVWIIRSNGEWQKATLIFCDNGRTVGFEWPNLAAAEGKQSKRAPSITLLRWQQEAAARALK